MAMTRAPPEASSLNRAGMSSAMSNERALASSSRRFADLHQTKSRSRLNSMDRNEYTTRTLSQQRGQGLFKESNDQQRSQLELI